MKSTLDRRLKRLEGTRRGVASFTDEELERAINLLVAQFDGRALAPGEAAELAHIQSHIDVPPSPLSHAELAATVDRDLQAFRRLGLVTVFK